MIESTFDLELCDNVGMIETPEIQEIDLLWSGGASACCYPTLGC